MDRKNIYIIILTLTTIIAACFALYFGINPTVGSSNLKEENDIVSNKAGNLNTINDNTNYDKIISNNTNDNANDTTNEKYTSTLRVDINTKKCLNSKENYEYNVYRSDNNSLLGISCIIDNDLVKIMFSDFDKIKANYGIDVPSNLNSGNYITIDNFSSKKVVDIYIKSMGNAIGNEVIFFLMENGTVEYMPVRKALLNNNIRSYGKIEKLVNIVEIVDGRVNAVNGPGYITPFAITEDGSYYELYTLVSELLK